ncbi:MAG TPA: DUF2911 domain-containing protein [Gemmatimonadales bacterium]|nr:DUF2911 domain-containing protein [Gemmatimonadales bacterium]
MPFLALSALTALTALHASPARPAPAPLSCITMNTEKLPLATRKSPLDSLSFKAGASDVKVCYGRPSLRGRHMLGGDDVPYGKLWRTGANEPTMIHTSGPLVVAGIKVPAGSYSLYTVPNAGEWEVIVNKSITQWGEEHTYTDAVKAQELGRGKVKPEALKTPVEMFTITSEPGFLVLEWETTRVKIPVTAGS